MKTFFGLMILITGLVLSSGCNKNKIDPVSLQRLESAIGEVRKLSDSLTSGTTREELRKQSNMAISALRDAVDLFQVKGQSSKPLGVDDLGKLVDEWAFFLSLASKQKRDSYVKFDANGPNNWDENSDALQGPDNNRMSFYQWQRVARRWPQTKSLLSYFDGNDLAPLPEDVADALIAYEITPYPEGVKKFFMHFRAKYKADPKDPRQRAFCWSDPLKDKVWHFELSMSSQIDQLIISEVGKEARKLDLKIKALL